MVNCVTTDVKFTSYATFAIAAYAIHMYYCLSFYHSFHFTSVFIHTKVVILILWWRTFKLEYWRTFQLVYTLYYACKQGKTVVVDEINCCLSPTMVKGIVEYFAKTADTNGQLIFTTHDNQLLDERDMLRSDEIWFVDKREGASVLYSHNDFKEHHTISPFRGYNEGRYGAIRFVNLLKDYAN